MNLKHCNFQLDEICNSDEGKSNRRANYYKSNNDEASIIVYFIITMQRESSFLEYCFSNGQAFPRIDAVLNIIEKTIGRNASPKFVCFSNYASLVISQILA